MISINLVNVSLDFGYKVSAVFQVGPNAGQIPHGNTVELKVPWHDLHDDPDAFSLLSWHTQVSDFAGRDDELEELETWADSEPAVSVKFITGVGGVGKSRLAAFFGEKLHSREWAAGFIDLNESKSYPLRENGTLVIIDYPEERRQGVAAFLEKLAGLGNDWRFRVLFLTRQKISDWEEMVHDTRAVNLVDPHPVDLGRMDGQAAHDLYTSALARAGDDLGTSPLGLSQEALAHWLDLAPENDRALFILAAAVYGAMNPDDPVVRYTGRDVVEKLARREIDRLRGIAKNMGATDANVLARLLAMAAIADVVPVKSVIEFTGNDDLKLGFSEKTDVEQQLKAAGMLTDGAVQAPKPDILAAAFTVDVFSRKIETAPELVWSALSLDAPGGLERIGRLSYDAEVVLGIHDPRLSKWLAESLDGNPRRCAAIADLFAVDYRPLGWSDAGVVLLQTLLEGITEGEKRAALLNNLSVHFSDKGDNAAALEASLEAVEVYRRLASANPSRFEPNLALSLNNLAGDLKAIGETAAALEAIKEAVDIRRRLASTNPARFEPALAMSLNNLSFFLNAVGAPTASLEASQEAVDVYRRLASADTDRFEPALAGSLTNLSNCLSDVGETSAALEAIKESVAIRRRLASANPARFEHDLALGLNNMSVFLSFVGETSAALEAVKEAVDIRRRLSLANPARFEPDLAMSLNNLSADLSAVGETAAALEAIQEAVDIRRRLASANPARFESDLAMSLNNLSAYLSDVGDTAAALDAIQEAVDIRRRLASANPARFEPDLARNHLTLGLVLGRLGRHSEAAQAFEQGTNLISPYAEQWPQSPHSTLLSALEKLLSDAKENIE